MEDYLKEFGISPQEFGIDRFLKTKTPVERSKETVRMTQNTRSSGMGKDRFSDVMLKNLPLAMAYVPFQQIEGVYNQEQALKSGTLFPNLDKPFLGRKV